MTFNDVKFSDADFLKAQKTLEKWVKIPSVSFPGFPASEVVKSAHAVAEELQNSGFQNVEVISQGLPFPNVIADRIIDPALPTVLMYAHHDVQPPGDTSLWKSPPFEATLREGQGGIRMYGRGTADDKAGILVHTASVRHLLAATGTLPVNLKILIEGEEEIGSPHLLDFLKTYKKRLEGDVILITDTANYDCGHPSLTVSLRGMIGVTVEVRSIDHSIHSGFWGGPVPDASIALCKMLATLLDDEGNITVPGVADSVTPLTREEIQELENMPFYEAQFREQSGLLDGVRIFRTPKDASLNPYYRIWNQPSLSINALQASQKSQAGNILVDRAWARVSMRLAQGMKSEEVEQQLIEFLKRQIPWGCQVEIRPAFAGSDPWKATTTHPSFEVALKALEKGYGTRASKIGCGATIPFVAPFSDAFAGAPAILMGVEDPYTNAHGENESLLLSDFKKAIQSEIYFLEALANVPFQKK